MYDFRELKKYMESLEDAGIPLCGIEVRHHHKTVFRDFEGYEDAEKTKKMNENSLVWLFSVTKVVTCIAAMRLVEEGKLGLDDRLDKYIPEFSEMKVNEKGNLRPASTPILVRHLFSMSAGLTYNCNSPSLLEARKNSGATTLDVVKAMAREPLEFDPGTDYRYSFCHDVLAALIEVVSGMTFGEYLKKIIFEPLGITNMGFVLSDEDQKRMAQQYTYNMANYTSSVREIANGYRLTDRYESGGAGLYATVTDYVKIPDTIACGGVSEDGYRLLRPETIALMEKNELCEKGLKTFRASPRQHGYGWGLCGRVHMRPEISLAKSPAGEFGWDGAAASYALIDRKNELAVFFATHVMGCGYAYERIHPHIRDLIYTEIK